MMIIMHDTNCCAFVVNPVRGRICVWHIFGHLSLLPSLLPRQAFDDDSSTAAFNSISEAPIDHLKQPQTRAPFSLMASSAARPPIDHTPLTTGITPRQRTPLRLRVSR